eukprot:9482048-Pyramimonas_sp.AAC.1
MIEASTARGVREENLAIATPTRRSLGHLESGPPEASPATRTGQSREPVPRHPPSTSFTPVAVQESLPSGSGTFVQEAGMRPLSQKASAVSSWVVA